MLKPLTESERARFRRFLALNPKIVPVSEREIQFQNTVPQPVELKIPLIEYFERIKQLKADAFQRDLAQRLERAFLNRHVERTLAVIQAESQIGKTVMISQTYPAWILGHDPLFRFALAMYNQTRSEAHCRVVIQMMQSTLHKEIFPDPDGWLWNESMSGFLTNARRALNDGQLSFNPLGLQSGLTGSGFDHLSIDDPYKNEQEAFSPTVRETLQNRYEYTIKSRLGTHSNVTGMFHRYGPDDLAGYLLDTGEYDYWRYASECDGEYVHERTQRVYPDPLGREVGELISPERRPASYYADKRQNKFVWLAMHQGRPSSEAGDFFDTSRISMLDEAAAKEARSECIAFVRSWDHAATEGGGDWSVGALMGMRPDGRVTVFEIWRGQVDSAGRVAQQKLLAQRDGPETAVVIPNDPGAAGSQVVFHTQQFLEGFTVVARPTSGSKIDRARSFSVAVGRGEVEFADDSGLPESEQWVNNARIELRDFPRSAFKDQVDALSDGYNQLFETVRRGFVVKGLNPRIHFVSEEAFWHRYAQQTEENRTVRHLPPRWTVYAAVKLSADASRPTSGVIVARAAENSGLRETLFVLAEYKALSADFYRVFDWISATRDAMFPRSELVVWAHEDSAAALATVNRKLPFRVNAFEHGPLAGQSELNWYLKQVPTPHPFSDFEFAARIYFVMPETEIDAPTYPPAPEASHGFHFARQEAYSWTFDAKGNPAPGGGVLDCLRIITHRFRTVAQPLTKQEVFESLIPQIRTLNPDGTPLADKAEQVRIAQAYKLARERIREEFGEDDEGGNWWDE